MFICLCILFGRVCYYIEYFHEDFLTEPGELFIELFNLFYYIYDIFATSIEISLNISTFINVMAQ